MATWLGKIFGGNKERRSNRPRAAEFVNRNPPAQLPPIRTTPKHRFPDTPEGQRLIKAETNVEEALKRETQLIEQKRTTGSRIRWSSDQLRTSWKELDAAREAYYFATGEGSWSLPIPPGDLEIFQRAVENHFGKIALNVGSKLERLRPFFYGFAAPKAIVSIAIICVLDDGRTPEICITLRERVEGDTVRVCDDYGCTSIEGCIRLESLVHFVKPDSWIVTPAARITASEAQVMDLASKLYAYGRPFLINPNADWKGLRDWWQRKIEENRALAERPVSNRFKRDI